MLLKYIQLYSYDTYVHCTFAIPPISIDPMASYMELAVSLSLSTTQNNAKIHSSVHL